MKRLIAFFLLVALTLGLLASCSVEESSGSGRRDSDNGGSGKSSASQTIDGAKKDGETAEAIREISLEGLEGYEVYGMDTDGKAYVRVTAPDFGRLTGVLYEAGGELTAEGLKAAIEANPDLVREYDFTAESSEEEAVQEAFLRALAEDIILYALENVSGEAMEVGQ